MTSSNPSISPQRSGDGDGDGNGDGDGDGAEQPGPAQSRSLRIAVALFAVGLVFIAVNVIPFFFGSTNHPLWLNLACLCAPAGFVLGIVSGWRSGRASQRAALAELSR